MYTADKNGAGEYTFSGTWARSGFITDCEVIGMSIGNGRNDSNTNSRIELINKFTGKLKPGQTQ